MSLAQCWKSSHCLLYVGLGALIFFLGNTAARHGRNATLQLQSDLKQQPCIDFPGPWTGAVTLPLSPNHSVLVRSRSFSTSLALCGLDFVRLCLSCARRLNFKYCL